MPSPAEFYKQASGLAALSNEMVQLQHDVAKAVNEKIEEADVVITETKEVKEEFVSKVSEILDEKAGIFDEKIEEFDALKEKVEKTLEEKQGPEGPAGADADEQYIIQEVLASLNIEKVVSDAVNKLPKPKQINEKTLSYKILEEVKAYINSIEKKEIDYIPLMQKMLSSKNFKVKLDQVDGINQTLNSLRTQFSRGYLHGGGDTVQAGSNVTITENNGKKIINATGVTFETPTGTVDGVNKDFTVTQTPLYVISDGVTYFEGAGYSLSSLTITLDFAPTSFVRVAL